MRCTIRKDDIRRKDALSQEIYIRQRGTIGDVTANSRNSDVEDDEILGYDPIAPGLLPASSDRRKWWLNNGAASLNSGLELQLD